MQIKQSQYSGPESKELTEFVEHALRSSLKRLGSRLRSTVVSLHDLNGLRRGIDQECPIRARAAAGALIVIRERDSTPGDAPSRVSRRRCGAESAFASVRPVVSHRTFISKREEIAL